MVLERKASKLLLSFTFEKIFITEFTLSPCLNPYRALRPSHRQEFRSVMFPIALLCKNRGKQPRNANLKVLRNDLRHLIMTGGIKWVE